MHPHTSIIWGIPKSHNENKGNPTGDTFIQPSHEKSIYLHSDFPIASSVLTWQIIISPVLSSYQRWSMRYLILMLKSFLFEDLRIAQQDPLDIIQLKALVVYCLMLPVSCYGVFLNPSFYFVCSRLYCNSKQRKFIFTGPDMNIRIIKTIYNALLLR